jgi:signal transduction histidine kinase/ABC-type nitrate/sulfonate/bicarbonate transport system substrate-binding protein
MRGFWSCVLLLLSLLEPVQAISAETTSGLTPVTIQLHWRHQFEFAGYYAAIKQGYYQQAGLDVQLKDWQPELSVNDEVLSGRSTFGIGYGQLVVDYAKGLPISLVMTSFQYSPVVLISHNPIVQLTDLSYNTVMRQEILQVLSLFKLARSNGAVDIKEVPSSWDLSDFTSGKVDVFSAYSTNEPFVLTEKGVTHYQLDPKSYGMLSYDDLLFTSQKQAHDNPQLVQAVRQATIAGWQYALSHPEEMVDWILAKYPAYKSKQALLYEAKETLRYVRFGSIPIGSLDVVKLQSILAMAKDLGLLTQDQVEKTNVDSLLFKPSRLILTEAEKAYLRAHPVIALANDDDWAPFEFINQQGLYDGIAAEYFRRFESLLGVKFKAIGDKEWSEVQNLAFSGDLPVMSCAVATPERRQYLNFTQPYLSFPMVMVAREGERFIEGFDQLKPRQVIAVVRGYWSEEYLKKHYPQQPLLVVASVKEGLEAVMIGKAFALSDNLAAINAATQRYGLLGLQVIAQAEQRFELAIGVHHRHPELLSILQKALDQISLEEKSAIYTHWLQAITMTNPDLKTLLRPYRTYIFVAVALFLVLLFWLLWRAQQQRFRLKLSQEQAHFAERQVAEERRHRQEQSEFFSMVAHEIKTPIAVIDLAVKNQALLDAHKPIDAVSSKRRIRIAQAVQNLNQLVDRFLFKGQLDRDDFSLSYQRVSMSDLSTSVQSHFMGLQRLFVSCPSEIVLTADGDLLQFAISNLVSNASKYSPEDSQITLVIQQQEEGGKHWCVLCVMDQGVGIAPEKAQQLFRPYARGDQLAGVAGFGLGLYIVNKIAQLHGGRLVYSPNPTGQGSVFCLYLPCPDEAV